MSIKIALAGNPNSGKTTMFNELTGASQYVGNWPGVTVEKKEGKLKGHKDVVVTDLPGIYSLSPYTLEEVVSRNYLLNEKPDVIINVVDASNIERNLYLTTQLTEIGIPVIVALNMIDITNKNGDKIDMQCLSKELGCVVMETSALKGLGTKEVASKAIQIAKSSGKTTPRHKFSLAVESSISEIEALIKNKVKNIETLRFYSVKLFGRDENVIEDLLIDPLTKQKIEEILAKCETDFDDDAESVITAERYKYIEKVVKNAVVKKNKNRLTSSDKIDMIITNRWLALPIFAAVMWLVYFISVTTVGTIATDWANDGVFGDGWHLFGIGAGQENLDPASYGVWIPGIPVIVEGWLVAAAAPEWLSGLVLDGIVGGVGAVLGFVPQMLILFLLLAFLEDCGYMARVAFIMDRVFRRFGLSGKSFIPMLISSGCGVPGIMASRTIENEKDRRMTIMLTTFIPCGAKLPIIALIAGALFSEAAWVAPFAYFLGVLMIILSGIILKKTKLFTGEPAPFVMELPQYHMPGVKGLFTHMWERGKSFIVKAGTVVFVACGVIWFLSYFGFSEEGFGMVAEDASLLAMIGNSVAWIFAPLGFGSWQSAVATITGLVAKENVVGTLGVLFGTAEAAEGDPNLLMNMAATFTTVSAMSFMVFNLLCAPCFAAIGAVRREMGSWKWMWIAIGYQTLLAYVTAFIIYQLGTVFVQGGSFSAGTAISILLIIGIIWLLVRNEKKDAIKEVSTQG